MACWTGTGDSYGYEGVAFTSAGDVWAVDGTDLLRLAFPAMSNAATLETIDITTLTSIDPFSGFDRGVACVSANPIICGVDDDGDAVMVDAGADTVLHNFGPVGGASNPSGDNPVWATYNPFNGFIYIASFGGFIETNVYRTDADGSNIQTVWSSSAEALQSYLLVASDGAVWWATDDNVYRFDEGVAFDSIADADNGELTHDPEDPTRTLAYPGGVGTAARFTFTAGSIVVDSPDCDDPGLVEAAAIAHDGSKGILATGSTVLYWTAAGGWTVGRVAWGSRGAWH